MVLQWIGSSVVGLPAPQVCNADEMQESTLRDKGSNNKVVNLSCQSYLPKRPKRQRNVMAY
eukprot:1154160-Pelagomonas_calceolata.AAC.2